MYKIGIIGTENSHASAFSKIINLPDARTGQRLYPDVKVVAAYDTNEASARALADNFGMDFVASDPDELLGKVDAMLITNRKGSLHSKYAMPFIEKGLPVFIDKPFTSNLTEAENLIKLAKKTGSKLCGGSGCRLAYDVLMLQNSVRNLVANGKMISASMNFAADPESEYDGFYFYAPHLTEMALKVFGYDVRSVTTMQNNDSRISIWRYDGYDVSLHFTKDSPDSSAIIYTKTGNIMRNIDISMIYYHEMANFVNMVKTGEMPEPYENLVAPVRMIAAIEESVRTGAEVKI